MKIVFFIIVALWAVMFRGLFLVATGTGMTYSVTWKPEFATVFWVSLCLNILICGFLYYFAKKSGFKLTNRMSLVRYFFLVLETGLGLFITGALFAVHFTNHQYLTILLTLSYGLVAFLILERVKGWVEQRIGSARKDDPSKSEEQKHKGPVPEKELKIETNSSQPSRVKTILRRWLDILTLGVLSAPVLILFFILLNGWIDKTRLPSWLLLFLLTALTIYFFITRRHALLAKTGIKHIFVYPPSWLGAIFGFGLDGLILQIQDYASHTGLPSESLPIMRFFGFLSIGIVLTIFFVSCIKFFWFLPNKEEKHVSKKAPTKMPTRPITDLSFEELCDWIKSDAPKESFRMDMFDRTIMAERIAKRLLQPRPPSQAVVGRLGAGKTTLGLLVQSVLNAHGTRAGKIHIVRIELWPYETTKAAVEGIIRGMVEALGSEVITLDIRGLPESYVKAMSAAGNFWSVLASLHGSPVAPYDVLKRFDDIAIALGHRFVIWVEDLERFAAPPTPKSGEIPESMDDSERLNPIRALLLGLSRMNAVSVVAATTSLRTRFDIEKIAQFVEEIPKFSETKAASILARFREGCLRKYDFVNTFIGKTPELDQLSESYDPLRSLLGYEIYNVADALPKMCSTPRILKQVLRATIEDWDLLHGEIDFDELLVTDFIRVAYPDVFAIIDGNIEALRSRSNPPDFHAGVSRKALWEDEFKRLDLDDVTRACLAECINFLFPRVSGTDKLQGVARHAQHTDYWTRLLTRVELGEGEKDQPLLKKITEAENAQVIAELIESDRSDAVESFCELISPQLLSESLKLLVRKYAEDDPSNWTDRMEPHGFIPLWRMLLDKIKTAQLNDNDAVDLIKDAIEITIGENLTLTAQIEHYYVVAETHSRNFITDARRPELKQYLRERLYQEYQRRPEKLVQNLKGGDANTLSSLCWGVDRIRKKDTNGIPFQDWKDFSKTVLDAMRLNPDVMTEQVAWLITKDTPLRHGEKQKFELDEEKTAELFGSVDEMLALFIRSPEGWGGKDWVQAVYRAKKERTEIQPNITERSRL